MDNKTLYEKAEKAINQAFAAAKQSMKALSVKAGEAAHVSKLLIEKATLEHRVSKKFAELGSRVYEKSLRQGQKILVQDEDVRDLIEETKKLDVELAQVEASLESEKMGKGSKK